MTYVLTIGPDELAYQALFLIRSIRLRNKDVTIFAYLVDAERDSIANSILEEIKHHATIIEGNIPIPDYPISSKIGALVEAEELVGNDPLILLDVDTLIINEPTIHQRIDADLFVKPVDLSGKGNESERDFWQKVYNVVNIQFPESRFQSTVDRRTILPYWNAGVVISKNSSFPRHWLNATRTIHSNIDGTSQFADQIALGAISNEYETYALSECHNYPVSLRLSIPKDVRVLHYHDYHNLHRVFRPTVRKRIAETGILRHSWSWEISFYRSILSRLWHLSIRYFFD